MTTVPPTPDEHEPDRRAADDQAEQLFISSSTGAVDTPMTTRVPSAKRRVDTR